MSTHLGEHFKKRRLEKGLSLPQIARMAGYTNIAKGIRRIEAFEQSGYVYPDLVTKLATALDIDAATVQRLYYEDYREWFAVMNKPVEPCMVRRMLLGGGVRRIPKELTTVEEMEDYAADFAKKCGMDVCLIFSPRIKIWFSKDGSVQEIIEAVPGEE